MTLQEAPQRQPLGEKYLGYHVPREYRPIEQLIIERKAIGWDHLIYFFLYAADPTCNIETSVKQTLASFTPTLETENQQELWNLTKTQLGKLPLGQKVVSVITANRLDLA